MRLPVRSHAVRRWWARGRWCSTSHANQGLSKLPYHFLLIALQRIIQPSDKLPVVVHFRQSVISSRILFNEFIKVLPQYTTVARLDEFNFHSVLHPKFLIDFSHLIGDDRRIKTAIHRVEDFTFVFQFSQK